jgi:hypothetical protein
VPVSRNGAQGLRNIAYRLEAVLLQVDNPEYFDPAAGCPPLATDDLPPDFPGTGQPVPVFTPRQVSLIRAVDEPQVSPILGLVADNDASPTGPGNITLPQPPRTFPLRWFRVTNSARSVPVPCRLQQRYRGPGGEQLPRQPWPAVCSLFHDVRFDPALEVTEFVWGLDQQFTSRQVDPARLVYRTGGDPPTNRPVALGRHFTAPGLWFELDFAPGSSLDRFLDEAAAEVDSAAHQTLLLQVLHAFLAEYARTPLAGGAPWEDPSRPSVFVVRNLRTVVAFHLLHRWHPPAGANQPPAGPSRFTLDDLRGCFTPGHPLFIDQGRFDQLCGWVAAAQSPESPGQRRDTLAGCRPNFESACAAADLLGPAFLKRTACDLLLNTLGLTIHAAALRLTGAEEHDLAYFYRAEGSGRAFVYLFDTDDLGNGTADVVRDLFFVSPVERALDARRRALGDTPDPPPSIDFVRCLEEELGECPASQAAHLAFHGQPPEIPALADLGPAARGERQTAGRLFDFIRTRLASGSFDHTAFVQACPEFLAHLGEYPVYEPVRLVGTPELPTFQALESAAGYCLCGCVSCVVSPEQNLRGILTAREAVNKLLLDACYRRVTCEAAVDSYPAQEASRTTAWDTLPTVVASAMGRPTGGPEFAVAVPTPGGTQTLVVVPTAVPAGWDRVFRTGWNPAPVPSTRVRPRMVW